MRELERLADEIARKIDRAVKDVENQVKTKVKDKWQFQTNATRAGSRGKKESYRGVPNRLSDFATDGGCAMRYLTAYGMKAFGFMMGLGGLITASVGGAEKDLQTVSVGLSLLIFSQIMWWGANRFRKSADDQAYARDQQGIGMGV
jgi:hypothetical protein